ncbi:ADP-ribosylation factor-like protein 6-interacting protein 4 isoform X8 [Orcinus orca]|uniref:ADP-ribosylation factor-like protein 6-interacting protein 4 isoform X8 n=1 Tax=Orcinus orca TaxID=9733 RepID=UPI001441D2F1|nr:ADP-ribosylation factor-like protein 6-interacting protein 4 isoform X8 [Orcinus orca]
MLRARRKDSDGRGHSCGKGPVGSGTGARLESRPLVWELLLEPQLASPGGQCVRLSFLGCPKDGTWGFRTKGSSALLRGRTAFQSTVPGRKSPSRRFLTRRRGAGLAVRPDGQLRRKRSSRGDFLSGGEAAEGAGWRPAALWLTSALASARGVAAGPGGEGRKRKGRRAVRTPREAARLLDPEAARPAPPPLGRRFFQLLFLQRWPEEAGEAQGQEEEEKEEKEEEAEEEGQG